VTFDRPRLQKLETQTDSKIILLLLDLLFTLKWADCVILLRHFHVNDRPRWFALRQKLLTATIGRNDTTATILMASSLEDPSPFYCYIPDLAIRIMEENFKEQAPQNEELSLAETSEKDSTFWHKFCSENPSDIKCKIFDL
jgi:hypothetical protein